MSVGTQLGAESKPARLGAQAGGAGNTASAGIGLGEWLCGRDGEGAGEWVIYGLGSCIGLILAEPRMRVSAMAHIVLPRSPAPDPPQPAKYADTAVSKLLSALSQLGASERKVVAHIVGGAKMLQLGGLGDIGQRNSETIKELLTDRGVPIIAECLGGTSGRTLRWNRERGIAIVSQVGKEEMVLTPASYRWG